MRQRILITGGAGFIGSNLANRLIIEGHHIIIFDNLSRKGCKTNLAWLREKHGVDTFSFIEADVKNYDSLVRSTEGVDRLYHLAGQVAVTTSLANPRQDFFDNALGTLNALEAARNVGNNPIFIYSSTNKVYGGLDKIKTVEKKTRYEFVDNPFGVSEDQQLDFLSPYGCSKGSGDQYTRDYARIFGLRTVVMRQSCIYGYRQFGIEDQGWLAWFMIAAIKNYPIVIYGNGKQVRDILFIDDLIDAYEAAVKNINQASGEIYNIGGGLENTVSIWSEFGPVLEELIGHPIKTNQKKWRPGDQLIYISDIRKAKQELGWYPRVSLNEGLKLLFTWIQNHHK